MKTPKIFFVAVLLSFIVSGNSYAQTSNKNKDVYYSYNVCVSSFDLGCPEIETMSGCYDVLWVVWENGKYKTIHNDIVLIGDETGKEYIAKQLNNYNYTPENNATRVHKLHIYCEGKLVALAHTIWHWTLNSEGDWEIEVYNSIVKCF